MIILLGNLNLYFEQETFMTSLFKNSGINHDKPFTYKNILSISAIVEVGGLCGNNLRHSWKSVIECLSKIDYYLSNDYLTASKPGDQNALKTNPDTYEIENINK